MSEREPGGGGLGGFVLGLAVGTVLGFLFAPAEGGVTRRKLSHRLRDLRDLADEKAGELRELVARADEEAAPPARSDRQALEERVGDARRRRRAKAAARRGGAGADVAQEEDEPLA